MYRISQLREERGLSQRALAKLIGASPKTVNFWESGKVEPSAKFICALADVFEVTCDYILGREDEFGAVNVMRELTESEKRCLFAFNKLDRVQAEKAQDFIDYLIWKNDKSRT